MCALREGRWDMSGCQQIVSAPCAMYVLNEIYAKCPRRPKWVPSQVQGVVEGFLEEGPPDLSFQWCVEPRCWGRGYEKCRGGIPCRGLEEAKYVSPKRNLGGFRGWIISCSVWVEPKMWSRKWGWRNRQDQIIEGLARRLKEATLYLVGGRKPLQDGLICHWAG